MAVGTITTQFLIGGQLLPSFMTSMVKANQQLIKLNKSTAASTASLAGMAKGFGLLAVAAAAIKVAVEAVEGMGKAFGEAVTISQKEQNLVTAIGVELQNINKKLGLNRDAWKWMTDDIEKQTKVLEDQSGIYHQVYLQGAATLTQYHLSHGAIVDVLDASKDLLAIQRLRGKSEEDLVKTYDAIGKALMGQPRGLKAVGIELDSAQQKILQHLVALGKWKEAITFITNSMREANKGGAEAYKNTPAGQSAIAYNKWRDALEKIGPPLQDTELRLKRMAYTLGASVFGSPQMLQFVTWLDEQVQSIEQLFDRALPRIEQGIRLFLKGFNEGWKQAFGEDFDTSVKRATDLLKTSFKEAFDYITGMDWASIGKNTAQAIHSAFDDLMADMREAKDQLSALRSFMTTGHWPGQTSAFGKKWGPTTTSKLMWDTPVLGKGVKGPGYDLSQSFIDEQRQKGITGALDWLIHPTNIIKTEESLKKSIEDLNKTLQGVYNQAVSGSVVGGGVPWLPGHGPIYTPGQGGTGGDAYSGYARKDPGGKVSTGHIFPNAPKASVPTTGDKPVYIPGGGFNPADFGDVSNKRIPASIRYMNPGGMWPGPVATKFGATGWGVIGGGNKIAKFPNPEAGAAAEFALWASKYTGGTLYDEIKRWTGNTGGKKQVDAYVAAVSKASGLGANDIVTREFLASPQGLAFMKKQASMEAGQNKPYPISDEAWRRAQQQGLGGAAGQGVTINYNVHHHGDSDPHRLAEMHRKHLLNMKNMVEDIQYERNRRAYVPRYV